jgi:hypothetical protein
MKTSRNFMALFLAICTFFVTQVLAAEQEVGKTPSVQAQTDENPRRSQDIVKQAKKPSLSMLTESARYLGKK